VVSNVPLDLTVDELVTWDELVPDELAVMAVRGAIPQHPADLAALYPHLFSTPKAAQHWLDRAKPFGPCGEITPSPYKNIYMGLGQFEPPLRRARYRLAAGGYGRTVWLSSMIQEPRQWLETRLGPVLYFVDGPGPQNRLKQVSVMVPVWPQPPCGEQTAENGEINKTACCVPTSLPAEWIGTLDDQREWLAGAVPGGVPMPEAAAVGQLSLDDPDLDDAAEYLGDVIQRLGGTLTLLALEWSPLVNFRCERFHRKNTGIQDRH
jgi:hypothetical protein